MKRTSIIAAAVFTLLGVVASDARAQVPPLPSPHNNVALGADVKLQGSFFTGGSGSGTIVSPETIVDDQFLPRGTRWDQGSLWWDERDGQPRFIFLHLRDLQQITGFTIQADNNDRYELSYWDKASGEWKLAWTVPNVPGSGMQTRPDADNYRIRYDLASPIWTTDLRFRAVTIVDRLYSVSEIRAFGTRA